jgi:hypothetical protein
MSNVYYEMMTRAKQDAKELVEEAASFDKAKSLNTYQGWKDYIDTLEGLFLDDIAHQHADSLDTVIYHGKAMQLCTDCPASVLQEAEAMNEDFGGDPVGLYELASRLAYWVVYQAVFEALQAEVEGCLELAESLQNVAWGGTEE